MHVAAASQPTCRRRQPAALSPALLLRSTSPFIGVVAVQRKKRTHMPDVEDPAKKGQPKSFVFRRGRHGAILRDLERDLRKVCERVWSGRGSCSWGACNAGYPMSILQGPWQTVS